MELRLVDVNSDTVAETWPVLLEAVQQAHFIALDLELSGLGSLGRGKGITTESHYSAVCETVRSRAVLSLGIACFQWNNSHTPEQSSLHTGNSLAHSHETPPSTEYRVSKESYSTDGISRSLSSTHLDVRVFNIWLLCQKAYTIDPSSAKFLLQHGFDFNKQFGKGIPYSPSPMKTLERGSVCVHSLLATILATRKPIVVHNGWIDLLFLYGHFYAPLPPSFGTLMADLVELFQCGIYDTKAIAQFEVAEEASFLEYLFRKCQRANDVLRTRDSPHLRLHSPSLPSSVPTELVPLSPKHTPSIEEVVDTTICDTFAKYGFCHKASCKNSHDVLLVLAQHEHRLQIKQIKRKRKREYQRAKAAKLQEDSSPPSKQHCSSAIVDREGLNNSSRDAQDLSELSSPAINADLAEQFVHELEAARSRLASETNNPETCELVVTSSASPANIDPLTASADSSSPITAQKPSFGHRAGFDAFMTGYIFAYYAITQDSNSHKDDTTLDTLTLDEAMIAGLSPMRNRLSNRSKSVPVILAKSQFAKTSQAHRDNCSKIADFEKLLYKKSS